MNKERHFIFFIGGRSTEHDASLHSYHAFFNELKTSQMRTRLTGVLYIARNGQLYWHYELPEPHEEALQSLDPIQWSELILILLDKKSFCFSLLHGNEGEDGAFQGLAEVLNLSGSFGTIFSASITMNKWASSFCSSHLSSAKTPKTMLISSNTLLKDVQQWIKKHKLKTIIIKPSSMGASLFTNTFKYDDTKYWDLIKEVLQYDKHAMLQELIIGDEYTIGCIQKENRIECLPVIKAKTLSGFLGHDDKHHSGKIEASFCDSDSTIQKMKAITLKLFKDFGLSNMSRFDYIYHKQSDAVYFLECNSIPGFGQGSAFPQMLKKTGINLLGFLEQCMKNENYILSHKKQYKYKIEH